MHEQLFLLRSDDRPWRLDDQTREVTRQGLIEARAALRHATSEAPAARRPATRRPAARRPATRLSGRSAA